MTRMLFVGAGPPDSGATVADLIMISVNLTPPGRSGRRRGSLPRRLHSP